MRPAQSAALRLLYLAIAGTVVLPLVLFAYASWGDYLAAQKTADERIERSLEVVHEHASKVFEAVDLAFLHVAQLFRDVADERILADQAAYHLQLKAIDDTAPEIQSIVLFDRDGHPLVSSLLYPVPRELSAADRDYFRVQIEQGAGAYVGEVLISRDPRLATDQFFTVSRRRSTPEGRLPASCASASGRPNLSVSMPRSAGCRGRNSPWCARTAGSWRAIRRR